MVNSTATIPPNTSHSSSASHHHASASNSHTPLIVVDHKKLPILPRTHLRNKDGHVIAPKPIQLPSRRNEAKSSATTTFSSSSLHSPFPSSSSSSSILEPTAPSQDPQTIPTLRAWVPNVLQNAHKASPNNSKLKQTISSKSTPLENTNSYNTGTVCHPKSIDKKFDSTIPSSSQQQQQQPQPQQQRTLVPETKPIPSSPSAPTPSPPSTSTTAPPSKRPTPSMSTKPTSIATATATTTTTSTSTITTTTASSIQPTPTCTKPNPSLPLPTTKHFLLRPNPPRTICTQDEKPLENKFSALEDKSKHKYKNGTMMDKYHESISMGSLDLVLERIQRALMNLDEPSPTKKPSSPLPRKILMKEKGPLPMHSDARVLEMGHEKISNKGEVEVEEPIKVLLKLTTPTKTHMAPPSRKMEEAKEVKQEGKVVGGEEKEEAEIEQEEQEEQEGDGEKEEEKEGGKKEGKNREKEHEEAKKTKLSSSLSELVPTPSATTQLHSRISVLTQPTTSPPSLRPVSPYSTIGDMKKNAFSQDHTLPSDKLHASDLPVLSFMVEDLMYSSMNPAHSPSPAYSSPPPPPTPAKHLWAFSSTLPPTSFTNSVKQVLGDLQEDPLDEFLLPSINTFSEFANSIDDYSNHTTTTAATTSASKTGLWSGSS